MERGKVYLVDFSTFSFRKSSIKVTEQTLGVNLNTKCITGIWTLILIFKILFEGSMIC